LGAGNGAFSMPDCRKRLVAEASESSPSRATVLGEMAHIVGEKETSPRGVSKLSQDDRNRYPNLILLCQDHHTIIDDDPAAWPIELLHQIKADHELWVEGLVPNEIDDPFLKHYAELVNEATVLLVLRNWSSISENAVVNRLPIQFVEGVQKFKIRIRAAVWPGKLPALEGELKNLANRASDYVEVFMKRAMDQGGWAVLDRTWKRTRHSQQRFQELAQEESSWEKECTRLLFNLNAALNYFADVVRSSIRPTYFLSEGRFYITDSLGVMSDEALVSMIHFADTYLDDPL